jgi:NADH-quinone oxidoreductase subunit C
MTDISKDADATDAPGSAPERTRHGVTEVAGIDLPVLFPTRDQLVPLVTALHADGYVVCLDVTAVDYLTFGRRGGTDGELRVTARTVPGGQPAERFEVVYLFQRHRSPEPGPSRLRVRVQVPEDDPTVPSLFELHPGTEAPEREVFDLFGITFTGHPDLTRILMPEDWIGHPLRKDYSSGRIPVQFKDAPAAR